MNCSVVVPLYNRSRTIRRTLESIRAQTLQDFETIIVDDGSSDDGPAVVESFIAETGDRRFRLVRQNNAGPGAARNRGIEESRSALLAFLDSDDEFLPHYLERGCDALQKNQDVAGVVRAWFDEPGYRSSLPVLPLPAGVIRLSPSTPVQTLVDLMVMISPCATMLRREMVRQSGGFMTPHRFAEDTHLWLKMVLRHPMLIVREEGAVFHREDSRLSGNYRGMRPLEPFLEFPEDIRSVCPPELIPLLERFFAVRAMKTACVYAFWGQWQQAVALRRRFAVPGAWRLPWFATSLLAATPLGALAAAPLRALKKRRARP